MSSIDWMSVAVAAVAGAAAVGLAELVFRGRGKRRLGYALVLGLCFVAANGALRQAVLPTLRAREAEREFQRIPALAALERLDPALAAEMKRVGASRPATARAEIRARLAAALKKYVGRSTDEAAIELVRVAIDSGEELRRRDPTLCYAYFFPGPGRPADVSAALSRSVQERELAAIAEVFRGAADSPRPVPAKKDVEGSLRAALASVSRGPAGENLVLLSMGAMAAPSQWPRVCDLTIGLYTEILTLPAAEQGPLLRYLLAGG